MKIKLLAGLVAATLGFAAQAGVVVLDDFAIDQAKVFSPTVGTTVSSNSVTNTGYFTLREIAISRTGGVENASAGVSNSKFAISNDTDTTSTATVTWTLDLAKIVAAIGSASFLEVSIDNLSIDQGGVNVNAGAGVRAVSAAGRTILWTGTAPTNPFAVSFASAAAVDSTWDNVRLTYACTGSAISTGDREGSAKCGPAAVPAPASLALLGLGLVGLAGLRRNS